MMKSLLVNIAEDRASREICFYIPTSIDIFYEGPMSDLFLCVSMFELESETRSRVYRESFHGLIGQALRKEK